MLDILNTLYLNFNIYFICINLYLYFTFIHLNLIFILTLAKSGPEIITFKTSKGLYKNNCVI